MAPFSLPPWPGSSTTSTGPIGFHCASTALPLHGVATRAPPPASRPSTGSTTPVGDVTTAVSGTVVVGAGGAVVVSGGAEVVGAGALVVVDGGAVMALALPLVPLADAQLLARTSAPSAHKVRERRRMTPGCPTAGHPGLRATGP